MYIIDTLHKYVYIYIVQCSYTQILRLTLTGFTIGTLDNFDGDLCKHYIAA